MRRLLATIAAALRSTVAFVWERCRTTGAWTLKAVASVVGSGSGATPAPSPLQDLEAAMAADALKADAAGDLAKQAGAVVVPPAKGGDGIDRLQRACRDINMSEKPAREDWSALSDLQRDWLQELSPSMRLVVGNIEREALVAHLRGGKGLKGVIRCDQESIEGWRHAAAIKQTIRDTCAEIGFDELDLDAPAPRIAI